MWTILHSRYRQIFLLFADVKLWRKLRNQEYKVVLYLYPLEHWHLRGDLLMTNRVLNTSIHPLKHLIKRNPNTKLRSNTQEVETQHNRADCRYILYSLSVVKWWGSLPTELVQPTTQESFEKKLDIFLRIKDSNLLWFTNSSFSSLVNNIPRFMHEGIGDPPLLDTEAR